MSISRLLLAIVLLVGPLGTPVAADASRPVVGCHACLVVDDLGRTLFARRAGVPLPNASTTKMMTALLVVAEMEPRARVAVSPVAAATGQGGLDLMAGERYTTRQLLYALLLTSSNDAAVALAERVAGSERAFVTRMNAHALELGLRHTSYRTSHGLDTAGHVSSAHDLALLAEEVLAHPLLKDIVATTRKTIAGPRGPEVLENRNLLLETYKGTIGVKTGFTARAGNVLVAAAERHDRRVVAVAMRSEDVLSDSRRLLDFGFAALRRTVLLGRGDRVGELVFDPSGTVTVVAGRTVRGITHPRVVEVEFDPIEGVGPPLEAGDVVGWVTVLTGAETLASVEAVAAVDVESQGSWQVSLMADLFRAFYLAGRTISSWVD
ncbi:MAG: D-alanyl-D-alanine carboxypeptidase family protein [Actinomycetota bacterium]